MKKERVKLQRLVFKSQKWSGTYFCLDLGDGCVHVFLTVLQHFNDGVLCVCWLGERWDEALEYLWSLDES